MIAIIDYRAGNLTSVSLAFETLGLKATITNDPASIRSAERVVFPGVGAAGAAMQTLAELELEAPIRDVIAAGTPFLGICFGTQLAFDHSDEDGGVACLGLIPGNVRPFKPADPYDKVPQMGWNSVSFQKHHPVLDDIADDSEFYFVHSYYPAPDSEDYVIGVTDYAGVCFASIVGRDNLIATQFHPEKSGRIGLKLLANFCAWDGTL